MIFVVAANEPAVFLMLAEKDVASMREGRTVFVDGRATGGVVFNKVLVSLHPTDQDALHMLHTAGHVVPELATHEPVAKEVRCAGCQGLNSVGSLFEGRCIVCWATEAKRLRTG